MSDTKEKLIRQLKGKVLSTKMDKTVVVLVERTLLHKKYKKRYILSKKYKVHDEKGIAKVGDLVLFRECRPMSKYKKHNLVKVLVK